MRPNVIKSIFSWSPALKNDHNDNGYFYMTKDGLNFGEVVLDFFLSGIPVKFKVRKIYTGKYWDKIQWFLLYDFLNYFFK